MDNIVRKKVDIFLREHISGQKYKYRFKIKDSAAITLEI